MAHKKADASILSENSRDVVESDLIFLGLINFENKLKLDTAAMLVHLRRGDIRSVIVSGDHVMTCLHIARVSGMIHPSSEVLVAKEVGSDGVSIEWRDGRTGAVAKLPSVDELLQSGNTTELAVTGSVWRVLMRQPRARELCHFIRIFGRCTPHDKVSVVSFFNQMGFITSMCGDGGNDCGALRTAHVGIALSDSEASVVSPFTSLDKSISSVVDVLLEGRCTLSSALSSYKYMLMYGMVETMNQVINAYFSTTFGEWNWVFMDGLWVVLMAFSIPYARAAKVLAPERPTSSILGYHTVLSYLGVFIINLSFVIGGIGLLFDQDWFQTRKWESSDVSDARVICDNYETIVIFLISGYQYISSGIVYNFGFVHRAPFYTNWRLWIFAIIFTVIHVIIIFHPSRLSCFFRVNCDNSHVLRSATIDEAIPIQNPWGDTIMPHDFRWKIFLLILFNTLLIIFWETAVMNGPIGRSIKAAIGRKPYVIPNGVGVGGRDWDAPANGRDGKEMLTLK